MVYEPNRVSTGWGVVLHLAAALLVIGPCARAEEHYSSDLQSRRDWFRGLIKPGTPDVRCCDIADCKRTSAEWRRDGWWALVQGKWRAIPSVSVLKTPRTIDGDAYVCSGDTTYQDSHSGDPMIYCFVPPNFGW